MTRTNHALRAFLAASVLVTVPALGQTVVSPAPPTPHSVTVKLIDQAGPKPFAFEPANFSARRGDTLVFVQASTALHNVHFKSMAKGAKLGSRATSPYLTSKGQKYTLVVGPEFTEGTYELVCEPHETLGMHGFLTVTGTH